MSKKTRQSPKPSFSQWSNNQSRETIAKAEERLQEIRRLALFGEYLPASAHYSFVPAITIPAGCTKMTIETDTKTLTPRKKETAIRKEQKKKTTTGIRS